MLVGVDDIMAHAANAAFGKPRVINVLRAMLVEAIVDKALPDGWTWCSSDYASCDFRHVDGTRLEVKQSASLQSWDTKRPSEPIYDIAPRTGYWRNGVEWVAEFARHADLYLFAHHPIDDPSLADHRDPYQWDFYVLAASHIPNPKQKRISLNSIRSLDGLACKFGSLGETIEETRGRYVR